MKHLDAKPLRINGRNARTYVSSGIPFTNSNGQLYGHWVSPNLYVVFSYGPHWPLFIYSTDTRTWYSNKDKTSRTTSQHHSYAYPHGHTVAYRDCSWMRRAARDGLSFILLSECEEAQKETA